MYQKGFSGIARTPAPGLFGVKTYYQKIKSFGASIYAYYPMDELAGPTCNDHGANGYDLTYANTTYGHAGIGDGKTSVYYPINGVSSSGWGDPVANNFPRAEGSISLWLKVDAACWVNGTWGLIFNYDSAAWYFTMVKGWNPVAPYGIAAGYFGGWVGFYSLPAGPTNWNNYIVNWSASGNRLETFYNGLATGNVLFAAMAVRAVMYFGAGHTTGIMGYMQHAVILNRIMTASEIADLQVI